MISSHTKCFRVIISVIRGSTGLCLPPLVVLTVISALQHITTPKKCLQVYRIGVRCLYFPEVHLAQGVVDEVADSHGYAEPIAVPPGLPLLSAALPYWHLGVFQMELLCSIQTSENRLPVLAPSRQYFYTQTQVSCDHTPYDEQSSSQACWIDLVQEVAARLFPCFPDGRHYIYVLATGKRSV